MKKTNYETKLYKSHLRPRITSQGAESGRSMVEMLGVLAIVGVISIGGIAGYIYGMNRYRTNEILDGGNKRAVLVASQLASEITPNLTEFVDYDETAGGTFSSDVEVWENEFGIQVSGVKKEVCENLIRMIGSNTPLRGLVNVDGEGEADLNPGECADGTNNNLYLVYNLEMLSKQAVPSGSRSEGTSIDSNDPAKDCGDDECCGNRGGTWMCSDDDDSYTCTCVPKNWPSACTEISGGGRCIACAVGTPQCAISDSCQCIPPGYKGACGTFNCVYCVDEPVCGEDDMGDEVCSCP